MKTFKTVSMIVGVLNLSVFVFLSYTEAISGDFPTKHIKLYSGFEGGATHDLICRAIAEEVKKELNVPVIVENHPGGSGAVCATLIAKEKPDGYTLGMLSTSHLKLTPLLYDVAYNPHKDFDYLIPLVATSGEICVMHDSPFKTIQDLLEYARKNPETLSYSTHGVGNLATMGTEYLAKQAKVKFKRIDYKGGAPACTALLGHHVDFTAGAGIHRNYIKQGLFKPLVVIWYSGSPDIANVPTFSGIGYKEIPGSINVLFGPKGIPKEILDKLEVAFLNAQRSPQFKKTMENLDFPIITYSSRQLEAELPKIFQGYTDLVNELALKKKQ